LKFAAIQIFVKYAASQSCYFLECTAYPRIFDDTNMLYPKSMKRLNLVRHSFKASGFNDVSAADRRKWISGPRNHTVFNKPYWQMASQEEKNIYF
jgi:hypothetical protein